MSRVLRKIIIKKAVTKIGDRAFEIALGLFIAFFLVMMALSCIQKINPEI